MTQTQPDAKTAPTAAETLAEMILRAAGSGLRHYTPQSRAEIIAAAEKAVKAIREAGE